jgi:hypothetical protein
MKYSLTKGNHRTLKISFYNGQRQKEAKGKDREEVEFLANSFFVPIMKTILFKSMKMRSDSGLSK